MDSSPRRAHDSAFAFVIGIAIGRGFRFGGEGWLAYKYGPQATQYIKDNLATASLVVAGVILVVGVVLIIARRRRPRRLTPSA